MKRQSVLLSSVFVLALAGSALAQNSTGSPSPQPPKAVKEVPAMGGQPNSKSGAKVIGLRANEVALSRLANTDVRQLKKETLGQAGGVLYENQRDQTAEVPQKIGTVTTELLDPAKKAVTYVGVKAGSGDAKALPWSQVQAIHQPNDELSTAMTPQAISSSPSLAQKATGKTIDVSQNLLGRDVTGANGSKVGTLSDVVVQTKNGTVDYAVVSPNGLQFGSANASHAVPWNDVKSIAGNKSQPVTLSVTDQQLAALPVFGMSKAEETKAGRAAAAKGGATPQPAP